MRGPTKYPYVVLAFFPREWRVPISRRDVVARRAVGLGAAGLTLTLLCTSFFGKYQSPGSGLTASDAVAIVLIALTLPFAVRALWRIWMSPFQFFPRDATSTDLLQRINDASRMHPDIGAELHDIAHKQGGLFEFQVRGAEFEPLNRWIRSLLEAVPGQGEG